MRKTSILGAALVAACLAAAVADASPTAAQKCEAGKNQLAGKYAACVQTAEKGLVSSGDTDKYTKALHQCEAKLIVGWGKLETKTVDAGGSCPSAGDSVSTMDFLDACSRSVADALAGGSRPPGPSSCDDQIDVCTTAVSDCLVDTSPRGQLLRTGQTTCYDESGAVIACAGTGQDGDLQRGVTPGFVDNGDGTITDTSTGLMWEKLADDGSIHDKDTLYKWLRGQYDPPAQLDAMQKIAALNTAAFAGHNDWRLPNHHELTTLMDLGQASPPVIPSIFHTGCIAGCTVTTCSCTGAGVGYGYWSSTTFGDDFGRNQAWVYFFDSGGDYPEYKNTPINVRAVRSGF